MGKEWAFKENYFLLKEQIDINWSGKNLKIQRFIYARVWNFF